MLKAVVFDFCRVFLFPRDESYFGELNALHKVLSENPKYNFDDNFVFNHELLDIVKNCCIDQRYDLYIFTSGNIQETPECKRFLSDNFKKVISASKYKLSKKKTSSYLILSDMVGLEPSEILFIDDSRENTLAAENAGMLTITFRNNVQFEVEIKGFIRKII